MTLVPQSGWPHPVTRSGTAAQAVRVKSRVHGPSEPGPVSGTRLASFRVESTWVDQFLPTRNEPHGHGHWNSTRHAIPRPPIAAWLSRLPTPISTGQGQRSSLHMPRLESRFTGSSTWRVVTPGGYPRLRRRASSRCIPIRTRPRAAIAPGWTCTQAMTFRLSSTVEKSGGSPSRICSPDGSQARRVR